ncbi:MAG: AMP-binding protein, partial [Actinomycetes bacterium]
MSGPAERIGGAIASLAVLREAGVLGLERPDKAARSVAALVKFGPSAAAALESWAVRNPSGIAVVDDAGIHTWQELADRSAGLARGLHSRGVNAGDRVGVLIRDHADFVAAIGAISRIGADTVLLNTSFAAPQVAGVVERESVTALVHDGEYSEAASLANVPGPCVVAWPEGAPEGSETIDDLIASAPGGDPPAPGSPGRTVILTSGTTGTPKGANRSGPPSLLDAATLLERIPLRAGRVTVIGAPLFHSWGFAHLSLASALGSTMVLRRRFNPAQVVADSNRYGADTIALVPVMLRRMLELDPAEGTLAGGGVRIIALSGSALPAELAIRATERYGHVLYNLYGSTEVAWATIADPADIAAAPGTAGLPPRGTVLRLYDEDGSEVEQGERGRIFVGNALMFEGYTGGGNKEVINGLM